MPDFYPEGNTVLPTDGELRTLHKIAGAVGGGSGGQQVTYTSGTPSAPANVNMPAMAYDPNGILPTLGWNTTTHTWN